MTYLNPTQMDAARHWQPLYLEAQQKIGVPWALLAGLHYRESNFGSRTDRVGGPFQFDPPLPSERVRAYGATYGISDLTSPETDVRTGVLCAAAFLQGKVAALGRPALTASSSDEACADAAWSYNGRAYGSWSQSPYVNNDPQGGRTLHIRGTVPDLRDPRKRVRIDQPDTRPGVLAVMRELRARLAAPAPRPAPMPSPQPAPAVENPIDAVLIAGLDGQFRAPAQSRFVVPYPALIGYANGKWWIRPATSEELKESR